MPFNEREPYGMVYGHPWARYEQNGVLYDPSGRNPDEDAREPEVPEPVVAEVADDEPGQRDFALESAKEFLRNILSGGPVTRSAVWQQADKNNQSWEKVEQAFDQLGGIKQKSGTWTYWKLPAE